MVRGYVKKDIIAQANQEIIDSDLFISIARVEWFGLQQVIKPCKIFRIILYRDKSEETELSKLYDQVIRLSASDALDQLLIEKINMKNICYFAFNHIFYCSFA